MRTDEIQAHVNRATGAVSFFDKDGAPILAENPDGGKSLTPNQINGMNTLRSRQEFVLAPDEAIYGLGQHQNGWMNYCGATVHLQQRNPTESAVPVLVSSRGYGILWDNPAITERKRRRRRRTGDSRRSTMHRDRRGRRSHGPILPGREF